MALPVVVITSPCYRIYTIRLWPQKKAQYFDVHPLLLLLLPHLWVNFFFWFRGLSIAQRKAANQQQHREQKRKSQEEEEADEKDPVDENKICIGRCYCLVFCLYAQSLKIQTCFSSRLRFGLVDLFFQNNNMKREVQLVWKQTVRPSGNSETEVRHFQLINTGYLLVIRFECIHNIIRTCILNECVAIYFWL